ncbi:proteasome assembly chaperone family protein [Methanothermococcus sp.]|uniref:proteasome assembly chaperone family protein n=1 Tax=Methanothermococcus sp. TaxID=2614238 RepID=UPI0025E26E4E|nr:proteasome assembly chaperone family protein [Methanothermococcus sp.]
MVKIIEKKINDAEPLNDAILIEGLPGIGHVGRIAAEHLIHEFNGEKVLELYCDDFPPQVLVNNDGTVEFMNNEIYLIKEPVPMVVVLGNTQALSPAGQYHLSQKIVEIGIRYGAKITYTLGGFGIGKIKDTPAVYVASTSKELADKISKLGAEFRQDGGSIIGAAGLMLTFSKLNGIEGVCLMGETPGYLVDPKSARRVLEILSKFVGFEVSMTELEERAKEMEKFLEKIKKFEEEAIKQQQQIPAREEDLRYIG